MGPGINLRASEAVHWTPDSQPSGPLKDMGVDHRRGDVAVPKKLLHRPDVMAVFQEVRGERVAHRVRGRVLFDTGLPHRKMECTLQDGLVKVVAARLPCLVITVVTGRRKDPLPGPLPSGVRVLLCERMRQLDPACPGLEIERVLRTHVCKVANEIHLEPGRQHRTAIARPFARTHEDLVPRQVYVLDAKPAALKQPQAGAVEQSSHQSRDAAHSTENRADVDARQYDRHMVGFLRTDDVF